MDKFFVTLNKLSEDKKISSRIRFAIMVSDLIGGNDYHYFLVYKLKFSPFIPGSCRIEANRLAAPSSSWWPKNY